MIRQGSILALLVTAFIFLNSCGDGKKDKPKEPKENQTSKLTAPAFNAKVPTGDSVKVVVSTSGEVIDSVRVVEGDRSAVFPGNEFKWLPVSKRLGTHRFRVTVFVAGKEEVHEARIKLLASEAPQQMTYEVVKSYPHDINDWTQGFIFLNDTILEATGMEGKSVIKQYLLGSTKPIRQEPLDDKYFGEGCAVWKGRIYQLTWKNNTGFVYDRQLNREKTFRYATEGWGLTTIGDSLYMSDGSNNLFIINPETFSQVDRLEVFDHQGPVDELNELEYIDGLVYANIWTENRIVTIDPQTGRVVHNVDMSGLLKPSDIPSGHEVDVLNGIAWDAKGERLLVTGKLWPKTFEIRLKAKAK